MAANEFLLGKRLTLTFTFTRNDTPTDPTTVRFGTRHSGDAAMDVSTYGVAGGTYTIIKLGVGIYQVLWTPPRYGHWVVRWDSTGMVETAFETSIYIQRSQALGSAA